MATGRPKSDFTSNLKFRAVVPEDLEPLRILYEQSFPIKYGQRFYTSLIDPTVVPAPWGVGPVYTGAAVDTTGPSAAAYRDPHSSAPIESAKDSSGLCAAPSSSLSTAVADRATGITCDDHRALCAAKAPSSSAASSVPTALDTAAPDAVLIPAVVTPGPAALASFGTADGTVAGAIAAQLVRGGQCLSHDKGLVPHQDDDGVMLLYILTLAVLPQFKRLGIATRLLRHCLAHARKTPGCAAVYLHVITYNTAAVKFYERCGFLFVREIPDFYVINGINYGCYLYMLAITQCAVSPAASSPAVLPPPRHPSAIAAQRVLEKRKGRIEKQQSAHVPHESPCACCIL